jgi:probable addiction module antidote protein
MDESFSNDAARSESRIVRAKGMSQIAQAAGLGRESLYKALSTEGNPEFATVLKVMRALGLKLRVAV